jgi:putative membrane protein
LKKSLGLGPVLALEGRVAQAQRQLGEKVGRGEKALDAMPLDAVRVELENRRRPLRVEAFRESLVVGRLVLDVEASRNEAVGDEPGDAFVGIDLGFQPSASASHRGGGEVQQNRTPLAGRFFQNAVDVVSPCDVHGTSFLIRRVTAGRESRRSQLGLQSVRAMKLLARLLINAGALWVAVRIVPGISYVGNPVLLLLVALVFGIVNTIIKPIVTLLSLPAVLLTLGLFLLVINACMLWLTSWVSAHLGLGFHVEGFAPAFLGAIVVGLVAWLLSLILVDGAKPEPKRDR